MASIANCVLSPISAKNIAPKANQSVIHRFSFLFPTIAISQRPALPH
jgi:hypothetical protein